jgi:hypothetical protein
MNGTKILDEIVLTLRDVDTGSLKKIYIDVFDNSLSRKWLNSLNQLLEHKYHLEKNYCFFGFVNGARDGAYILNQVNDSIAAINQSSIGYHIDDYFSIDNTIVDTAIEGHVHGRNMVQQKLNNLHRYFEDLQGVSGAMSPYYTQANPATRWHIRQLNLLCHEFESWALSYRKTVEAPEWVRPSQLMCWLNAPRFNLEEEDYDLFGIETINRSLGGIYVGVNKAVGKHHWEVFHDEGRDSRIHELTTTSMRSQTEAAGDFDIEWANDPGAYDFQKRKLQDFRHWLVDNGFDPEDKSLTIGHPQVGQINLQKSFGTSFYQDIWKSLNTYLDVYSVATSDQCCVYNYHWSDPDFQQQQINIIQGHNHAMDN